MIPFVNTLSLLSPYVRLAHDYHCRPNFVLPRRRINDHALLYFRQGRGKFIIGGHSYPIAPGSVFVIRPDVLHSFTSAKGEPMHMLNLHFDLVQKPGCEKIRFHRRLEDRNPRRNLETLSADPRSPDHLPAHMKILHVAAYERLFHVILSAYPLRNLASELWLKAAMIELLSLLFRQKSVSSRLLHQLPQIERAAQFMGAHLDRPLTLAEMARAAALSRSHFATSFTAYYRVSPAKFHLRQRIEKAAMELILGPRGVKEVATAFGFQTVHHFTRCFAKLMGMPPASYRLAYGSRIAVSKDE